MVHFPPIPMGLFLLLFLIKIFCGPDLLPSSIAIPSRKSSWWRMNHLGTNLAEDSCFIKYQHERDVGYFTTVDFPEEAVLKNSNGPVTGDPVIDIGNASHEKGLFSRNQRPESVETAVVHQDEKDDFPEGGLRAWSVVLGAFCGSFSVFGIINSTAVLLDYLQHNQLKDSSPSSLGWIFGTALFLTFFCGAPVGPIFDAYGPRALIFAGSVLLLASMFLLGLCTRGSERRLIFHAYTNMAVEYWHFFLVYSVMNGLGGCLIVTPVTASIGHFFLVKRGNATGISMTAGSLGGIIFPLMLQKLFPTVGFAWATRILGFMLVFLLVLANLLIRSRLPRKKLVSLKEVTPDLTLFKELPFFFVTLGIFLMEWGIFVPLTYITSYASLHGHSTEFSYQILAYLNAGSFFGRLLAGIVSDMVGRINTLIVSIAFCVATCFGVWLPAGDSTPMIVVFAVIFGFVSGSNLSLSPVCVGQMCKTENYGRYFATCWMVVAFGTLTGLPIAGEILTANGGSYDGLIIFAGLAYAAALLCLVAARVLRVGWKINVVY
ncbi:major facilitator superfamily domain-containing protein [Amylocarpus encephaloides]|uniref:Major facilitator superfamily domain-containing protein n=1 Tax=Amylocarpus encephaloides TaxID=45428 RepID=A0A9P7YKD8_9HELO|nr:major facilitator superfamily domain-containing protein [Amylocarpus encephaloides]